MRILMQQLLQKFDDITPVSSTLTAYGILYLKTFFFSFEQVTMSFEGIDI